MRYRYIDGLYNNGIFNTNEHSGIPFLMEVIDDDKKETILADESKETVVNTVDGDITSSTLISEGDRDESKGKEKISSQVSEVVQDVNKYLRAKHQNKSPNHVIPSDKETKGMKIKYTDDTKAIKYIEKSLTYNANETESASITHEDLLTALRSNNLRLEELAEVIGSLKNKTDTGVKSCIKAVENNTADDLDALRQNDHGIYGPLEEFAGYELYGMGDEKFKSVMETVRGSKRYWSPLDSEQTTLTVLPVLHSAGGDPDENEGDQGGSQGDTTGSSQADVTSQEVQDHPQGAEMAEDSGTQACYQESSDLEEAFKKALTELAMQVTRNPTLPAKSLIVTGLNCKYFTEDHHAQVKSQCQQLARMIAAGNIPPHVIIELFHAIVGHIVGVHHCISELLSPIVDVVNNVEELLVIKNINNTLRRFIVEVLRMSPLIAEAGQAMLFPTCNGPDGGLILKGIFEAQLINRLRQINQSRTFVNLLDNNNLEVTFIAEQDTDVDDSFGFCSDVACCVDHQTEILELLGCQCQLCAVLLRQRKYIIEGVLGNTKCCSLLNDELRSRLAALVVDVNAYSTCYFRTLQIHLPFEALQRNLMHTCQSLPSLVESTLIPDPVYLRRVFKLNELFINWNPLKSFKHMAFQQVLNDENAPLITSEHLQRLNCITGLQQYVDKLCNPFKNLLSGELYQSFVSMLQPFVLGAVVSKHIPSYMESVQKCFARLQHDLYCLLRSYVSVLPNTLMPRISLSVTVVSGDTPISMDHLDKFLGSCLASKHQKCHITRLLHLPPTDITNNEPMMIVANFMFTFPSTLLMQAGFNIDPVDAVDQHGRDSLVAAVEPSYSFQDHEQSSDSVEQSDVSFSDSIPYPNDSDKKLAIGYLNIHEHFWATNGSCDYHVSNNADHSNSASSEVNHASVEATISNSSSNSDSQV